MLECILEVCHYILLHKYLFIKYKGHLQPYLFVSDIQKYKNTFEKL